MHIKGTGDYLSVHRGVSTHYSNASNSNSIQAIEFADGTVWEWADILRRPLKVYETTANQMFTPKEGGILHGTGGDDSLSGNSGADTLYGGEGDDVLEGGFGHDTYIWGRGDGNDTVIDHDSGLSKNETIVLHNLNADDIELGAATTYFSGGYVNDTVYTDLLIRVKATGETLTVKKGVCHAAYELNAANAYGIQHIVFADGTAWSWEDIRNQPWQQMGGLADLRIPKGGATVVGDERDNTLHGNTGDDTLYGGDGNDLVEGNAGSDTLNGGAGADTLRGGAGDDVYVFNRGDGRDSVQELHTATGQRNVIRLGADIGVDDIELLLQYGGVRSVGSSSSTNDSYLIVHIKGTDDYLSVYRGLSTYYNNSANTNSIQAIEFADGTVWEWSDILQRPMKVFETTVNQMFTPKEGGVLHGTDGDDSLSGNAGADTLYGGGGGDLLEGGAGNDILNGGSGADTLRGGEGDDVYVFNRGDGRDSIQELHHAAGQRNVIRLGAGIGVDDIELLVKYDGVRTVGSSSSTNDSYLIVHIKGTDDYLSVYRGLSTYYHNSANANSIQAIEFADGTVWEWADILQRPLKVFETTSNTVFTPKEGGILHGTDGNDTLSGNAGADTLYGGAGNDVLQGGHGHDTYIWGLGDGNDTVIDYDYNLGKNERVVLRNLNAGDIDLGASTTYANGNSVYTDLIIRAKATGETLTVKKGVGESAIQQNVSNSYGIQHIVFADGTSWSWEDIRRQPWLQMGGLVDFRAPKDGAYLVGDERANTIYGNVGNDVLDGGAGNDILRGGEGDDVYLLNPGGPGCCLRVGNPGRPAQCHPRRRGDRRR